MSIGKKVLIWIIIAIATVAFLFVGLVVAMMLAPGMEVFGVRYVSAQIGKFKESRNIALSGTNIVLNTHDVPIEIVFGGSGEVLQYVQEFQGFTKSSDKASVNVKTEGGTTTIDIGEYKKFIWSNRMTNFSLKLNLPLSLSSNSLTINSDSSTINLTAGATTSMRDLSIKTTGKVNFNDVDGASDTFTITNNLAISTRSNIALGSNVNIGGSVTANVGNEDLTITNAISGDINFTSGSGDLNFYTCRNLTATTGSGDINQPQLKLISGNLIFKTTSGDVTIDTVNGGATIGASGNETSSGVFTLGKVVGATQIYTRRGESRLGIVGSLLVRTSTGDISVDQVLGKLDVISVANGKLACGKDNNTTCVGGSAVVYTKNGEAKFIGSIYGNLEFFSSNATLLFKSCNNLIINKPTDTQAANAIGELGNGSVNTSYSSGATVAGTVNAYLSNGSLTLASVGGSTNTINSKYGNVSIATISGNLTVSKDNSYNARYTIGSVQNLVFRSTYGAITVGSVTSADIQTNARVSVGDAESATVGNVTVAAISGDVVLKNTTGTVNVVSNGSITIENKSGTEFNINRKYVDGKYKNLASGAVTATGLQGNVIVYSEKKVDLGFAQISGNVDVLTTGVNPVKIDAKNTPYNSINYHLQCQYGPNVCTVNWGNTPADNSGRKTVGTDPDNDSFYTIKVLTTNAAITLNLKEAA